MSTTVTCPQCQAGLRIDQALGANQLVACPHCKLKFVPPAASGSDPSRSSFLPWVLLAVVVGLGVGGVVWNNFARNTEEKPADPKPPAIAQNSQNGAQQTVGDTQPPKKIAETPNTPKPSNGEQSPDEPKPMPKKTPPKTYAETKQGLNEVPPPPVVEKKSPPVVEKKAPAPVVDNNPPPPVEVKAPPIENKKPPSVAVSSNLPHPKQKQINDAIAKGVAWLKKEQLPSGTWPRLPTTNFVPFTYSVGYASFGGLTLLECGVPADDPAVQKAADFVRNTPIKDPMHRNYEMSSAILFLDRLGDERDEPLIQAYALQIVAGQRNKGGWSYVCPELIRSDMQQLLTFLKATRLDAPEVRDSKSEDGPLENSLHKAKGGSDPGATEPKNKVKPAPPRPAVPPLKSLARNIVAIPVVHHYYFKTMPASGPPLPMPLAPMPGAPMPLAPAPPVPAGPNANIPGPLLPQMAEDNSNSQFAMLALWAARRHGVPTERVLLLAGQRYAATQSEDGGWGYQEAGLLMKNTSTPTMTCVGLLSLAMAHASTPTKKGAPAKPLEDPRILRGLAKLGNHIDAGEMKNFYLLWSIERVGTLFEVASLGNRDWYEVGVEMLLPSQESEGHWSVQTYPGSTNTMDSCFALLFLKRSNLVQDLTERLPFLMSIPDRTPSRR
jgi:hypothetical protein